MSDAYDAADFAERRSQALWWQGIAIAVIATLALAPWDIAISRAVFISQPNRVTAAALWFAERLGNGGGVVAILVALVILDRRLIGRVPQLLAASIGAGLLADCLKEFVGRTRPHSLDLANATFSSTFHGWLPHFTTKASELSFPSGHATTAAGLAVALVIIYPRWRWLCALGVAAVMTQRVVVHAHFPTDVMVGAILGAVWSRQCFRGAMGRMFARLADKIDDMIATRVNKKSRQAAGLSADLRMSRSSEASSASSPSDEVIIPDQRTRRRSA